MFRFPEEDTPAFVVLWWLEQRQRHCYRLKFPSHPSDWSTIFLGVVDRRPLVGHFRSVAGDGSRKDVSNGPSAISHDALQSRFVAQDRKRNGGLAARTALFGSGVEMGNVSRFVLESALKGDETHDGFPCFALVPKIRRSWCSSGGGWHCYFRSQGPAGMRCSGSRSDPPATPFSHLRLECTTRRWITSCKRVASSAWCPLVGHEAVPIHWVSFLPLYINEDSSYEYSRGRFL